MSTYNYTPGLGSTASYQVSGKPWLSASISPIDGVIELKFPAVTSWVSVRNMGGSLAIVGFSEAGILLESHGYPLDALSGTFGPVDLKVTRLYVSGSRNIHNAGNHGGHLLPTTAIIESSVTQNRASDGA